MTAPIRAQRVAVYGTLKRGLRNHRVLRGARYIGSDRLADITLYDLGAYPGAKLEPSDGVGVEVYTVTGATLRHLDWLEGYQPLAPARGDYDRQRLSTRFGPAWVYLYNWPVRGCRRIVRGGWQPKGK